MKIVSWNVNGIRACYKKGLVDFLKQEDPDIFCVQETKAQIEQLEQDQISPLSMPSYWCSAQRKGYSGVATFAKKEAGQVQQGFGVDKFDAEGRTLITKFDGIEIYNIYFPNGAAREERHDYKQEFLASLFNHLKKKVQSGQQIIVLGDYNIAHREIDVFDPIKLAQTSGFLPEERQWFSEFLDLGFVDCFRRFFPEMKDQYTWWSYRERARIGNRGWRIDYICVTENLIDRVSRADIFDQIEGSDHCPISIEVGA